MRCLVLFTIVVGGCAAREPAVAAPTPVEANAAHSPHGGHGKLPDRGLHDQDDVERALDEVAAIHGAPGPWAVAGYRMSAHALKKLGLERGSLDLVVVHWTPKEVRYSCIADGAQAHSGASVGKLSLSVVDTTADNVLTVYRSKKTGSSVALRPTASFRERYADTPPEKARELGREVLALPEPEVFEEIPVK